MNIAQSYVACIGVSVALGGLALVMLFMGVFRRGAAEGLDDSAAGMLQLFGGILLALIALFWIYAGPRIPPGTLEKLLR